jgi:F-type H+-transporting ATPase subunit alpha
MDDRGAHPDVAALLQALREQVGYPDEGADAWDADAVRRISARIAALPALAHPRPDVPSLFQQLRTEAARSTRQVHFHEVGTVQHIGNGVATLSGLPRACTDELVTFPTGVQGLILNLDHTRVDVTLLGPDEGIQGGDLVTATGERLRVPVGTQLVGRVVDPLGVPLDNAGPIEAAEFHTLERDAPGIVARAPVNEPLHTGTKIVDALFPIGRGQRELIIGNRQTGKTALAVDAILSQRDSGVLCVYVAVGQKKSSTLSVIDTLRRHGALEYTIVVVSSPDAPPSLRYLAPYSGCTMAEFLMHIGRDVLVVYDDLSKHADAYRELSLLLRRPPGREAYPGDIFYLHARLLERACKLNEDAGGGSLTALPIVEMQRGNISAYIPTNLISITDGQIVLDAGLFNRGLKPAVDVGRSVSRVGGAAQTEAMRAVSGRLKLELAQYEEVAAFARFGAEVDEATQRQIRRGERLRAALGQPAHRPLPLAWQIVVLLAATEGLLDDVRIEDVPAFEIGLGTTVEAEHPGLCRQVDRHCTLEDDTREAMLQTITDYRAAWREERARSSPQGAGSSEGSGTR